MGVVCKTELRWPVGEEHQQGRKGRNISELVNRQGHGASQRSFMHCSHSFKLCGLSVLCGDEHQIVEENHCTG